MDGWLDGWMDGWTQESTLSRKQNERTDRLKDALDMGVLGDVDKDIPR